MLSYLWKGIPGQLPVAYRKVRRDRHTDIRLFFREYSADWRCTGQGECDEADLTPELLQAVDAAGYTYVTWPLDQASPPG